MEGSVTDTDLSWRAKAPGGGSGSGRLARLAPVSICTLLLSLVVSPARATVYRWQDQDGAQVFTNSQEEVPESQRSSVKTFTAKPPVERTVKEESATDRPEAEGPPPERAWERGFERGLATGERQVKLATDLARTLLAAVPRAPSQTFVREPPQVTVAYVPRERYVLHAYPWRTFIAPYGPSFVSPAFGYASPRRFFVPHSHFFPGTFGPRSGLFFPYGHWTEDGSLVGWGYVVP
jgi:hypothetical protein